MNLFRQNTRLLISGTIVSITFSAAGERSIFAANSRQGKAQPMNVLFLISDDMRAELNVLGSQMAQTPNLDKLAKEGVCFTHAYCQYPLSCPSRSSILTGRRPTTIGLYTNREWFGATYPDWISLPNYFRIHGYETLRSGKVFHGGIDDTEAWSEGGYQLGEKGKWSKAGSLWEQGTRVPFIIIDPRAKGNGQASPRIVELLDIYPTLVDLCGLPEPEGLEGASLRPLLDHPLKEWDRPAYTVWNEHGKGVTGVVVRTEQWRYAEFFGAGAGAFLTDPIHDPDEFVNLVYDPEFSEVVKQLHQLASAYVAGKTELPPIQQ